MPLTQEHAAATLDSVFHLLSRPNIHTIDVRPKTVRGEKTDELAVVVTVDKKKRAHQLGDDDYSIPRAIEAAVVGGAGDRLTTDLVPTDVVEGAPFRRATLDDKVRPTIGGYMISVQANWFTGGKAGTLGLNMVYSQAMSIVTNNHVISHNGNVGSTVYQPDPGLLFQNNVATVTGYLPIFSYGNPAEPNPVANEYDLAWAKIDPNLAALNIKDIGQPVGTRAPVVGEHVRWIGKSTGTVQHATIQSITTAMNIPGDQGRWEWWQRLIDLLGIFRAIRRARCVGATPGPHSWRTT